MFHNPDCLILWVSDGRILKSVGACQKTWKTLKTYAYLCC